MAGNRTAVDKIFTNFDDDPAASASHCDISSRPSNNDGTTPGCDIVYTNSPTRQYPAPMSVVPESMGGSMTKYIPLLKHLDPDNGGYLSAQSLLGYFDRLGLLEQQPIRGHRLDQSDNRLGEMLEYLGIVGGEEMLDLTMVSGALNDHIAHLLSYDKYNIYAGITALLCDEISMAQNTVANLSLEKEQFAHEMQEMHSRVNEMSKQINGIHYQHDIELQQKLMNCEHQWKEKLKGLEQRTKLECTAYQSTIEELKRNSEMNTEDFESVKKCLRTEIETLKQNNRNLENKIEEMKINLVKMEDLNNNLKSEILKSKELNERLITIESYGPGSESDSSLELIKNLEELMKVNQALKDRNDELEINMLNIPLQKSSAKSIEEEKPSKRKNDFRNESPKMSPKSKWSRKNSFLEADETITSLSDECDEILSLSDVDLHGSDLEEELDHVKIEIMKMISEKKQQQGGKDTDSVKKVQARVSQLEHENKKLRQTIQDLQPGMKIPHHKNQHLDVSLGEKSVRIPDILVEQMPCIDRSSPDGQEREEENQHICSGKEDSSVSLKRIKDLELKNSDLEQSNCKLLEEKKHLEESLELMQSEFESMEDYWQGKMSEERAFYEDQVKVNESQFKELEMRMKEYEDLLVLESTKTRQLDTIEEDRNLEEKVTEWEEEISHLHSTLEQREAAHEEEISAMREKLGNLESAQQQCKCGEMSLKRRNLESFWMRVVKSDTAGPLSLPSVLYLKESKQNIPGTDTIIHNKEGGSRQDMFTQAPQVSGDMAVTSAFENSLVNAYRAILSDISRELSDLSQELAAGTCSTSDDSGLLEPHHGGNNAEERMVKSCLQTRLVHMTSRCYQLQYNLHQTRGHCASNIAVLKEQHESEMGQLESLVVTSQELLGKQSKRFMRELDKLVMTDNTIRNLITENDQLTAAVNEMRSRLNKHSDATDKSGEERAAKGPLV